MFRNTGNNIDVKHDITAIINDSLLVCGIAAVDFPKTGVPAELPEELRPKEYPKFMQKPHKSTCDGKRIISKLYKQLKDRARKNKEKPVISVNKALQVPGYEKYVREARDIQRLYRRRLKGLLRMYRIRKEEDAFSNSLSYMSYANRKKVVTNVNALLDEMRTLFNSGVSSDLERQQKACSWYYVAYHDDYNHNHNHNHNQSQRKKLLSFGWIMYDVLCAIRKTKE